MDIFNFVFFVFYTNFLYAKLDQTFTLKSVVVKANTLNE